MRIGIEAQRIFRKKKGGMDVVAVEIIKSLQKLDKDNEYIIYASPNADSSYSISETSNFKIKFVKGFTYFDWEQISLPLQAKKDKLDLLHCTSNTAPLWGPVPTLVTIHDIIYLEKREYPVNVNWYQRLGNYYRSIVVPGVVARSEQIITVSEFEKKNLLSHFELDDSKVKVVSNGVNEVFRKVYDKEVLNKVKEKYRLPEKFIFYMGNTEPRKNLRNMLKAYSILTQKQSAAPSLVITNITREYLANVLEDIGEEKIAGKIILTGYADFKDLPALYTLADFYVYPSFREGFGLPILEAMACGTAVITSNTSSMPEIAGEAALLVDPLNPESIAGAMQEYMLDDELKLEKIRKGQLRYRHYTWDASAKKLLDIYYSMVKKQYSKKTLERV